MPLYSFPSFPTLPIIPRVERNWNDNSRGSVKPPRQSEFGSSRKADPQRLFRSRSVQSSNDLAVEVKVGILRGEFEDTAVGPTKPYNHIS